LKLVSRECILKLRFERMYLETPFREVGCILAVLANLTGCRNGVPTYRFLTVVGTEFQHTGSQGLSERSSNIQGLSERSSNIHVRIKIVPAILNPHYTQSTPILMVQNGSRMGAEWEENGGRRRVLRDYRLKLHATISLYLESKINIQKRIIGVFICTSCTVCFPF
jgi:hypothetical protein